MDPIVQLHRMMAALRRRNVPFTVIQDSVMIDVTDWTKHKPAIFAILYGAG